MPDDNFDDNLENADDALARVKRLLGNEYSVSDMTIQDELWERGFDVEQTVEYLKGMLPLHFECDHGRLTARRGAVLQSLFWAIFFC